MLYFSDNELDDFLLEDIYRGDLTTHALGLESIPLRFALNVKMPASSRVSVLRKNCSENSTSTHKCM